ncbi:reverse transcriptase [Trichonephila clavipes]|nr:reverse transcriptase [Trichonephila clavipes]
MLSKKIDHKGLNMALEPGIEITPAMSSEFGDGPCSFEPRSSDEDNTGAGTPSSLQTAMTDLTFISSSNLMGLQRFPVLKLVTNRHLERSEAVVPFRLTTGHDFLGVYLHWLSLAADASCPFCGNARMDGDHLLQCTGLDDIVSQYWKARRQMVKKPSTGVG